MSHEEGPAPDGGELIPAEPEPEDERSLRGQDDQEPSLQQFIELERSRVDRDNRQTEVNAKALEIAGEQDKRLFELTSERLRLEDRAERRRFVFVCFFVAAIFVAVVVVTGLIMWMAFFGDDAQRAVAQTLGKGGLFGLAGYAVVSGLMRLVRSLVPNRPGNPEG